MIFLCSKGKKEIRNNSPRVSQFSFREMSSFTQNGGPLHTSYKLLVRFASLFRAKRFATSFHKMIHVPTKSYFARKLFNEVAISREYISVSKTNKCGSRHCFVGLCVSLRIKLI